MIKNPNYKGIWKPKLIKNPNYKGVWFPRKIKTEKEVKDPTFGYFPSLSFLGLEFYQATSGSTFNNFLVTDDEEYAAKVLRDTFLIYREAEVKSYNKMVSTIMEENELEKIRNQKEKELKKADKKKEILNDETGDQKWEHRFHEDL